MDELEVGGEWFTCKFVEFIGECDGEEEELVADCDEESNGEVVVIKGMDGFSHCCL